MSFVPTPMRIIHVPSMPASYPSHTRAATVLRPYCDQFFDQIALDRSKVSLRSHYGLSVVAVSRTARTVVAVRSPCSRRGRAANVVGLHSI